MNKSTVPKQLAPIRVGLLWRVERIGTSHVTQMTPLCWRPVDARTFPRLPSPRSSAKAAERGWDSIREMSMAPMMTAALFSRGPTGR